MALTPASLPNAPESGSSPGVKLLQGYRSQIAFSLNAHVRLWEKTVQPPGLDYGEPIPTDRKSVV